VRPLVSVIVLSFNRVNETAECLRSVFEQDYRPFEVVVLDNGSVDGSPAMIKRDFPHTRLIELDENVGACAGRNLALEACHGRFVLQVDNDAVLSANCMRLMARRLSEEKDLGIAFARIVDPGTGRSYRPGYGNAHVDDEFYTWRFHGCAAMIRRRAIEEAGYYLPEEFFRAAEENDLAVRVLDAGYNILYMPAAVARHKLSALARDTDEIAYLTVRNNLAVAWKFLPLSRAAALTLWRVPHYVFSRLVHLDAGAFARSFGIVGNAAFALRNRRPVSRGTALLIDALTISPAMTLARMRALREAPGEVGFIKLSKRRLTGAA